MAGGAPTTSLIEQTRGRPAPHGDRDDGAYLDYDVAGLEVAVHVAGAINDPTMIDRGWTAEIKLPWAGLGDLAGARSLPPRDGDTWGLSFGRFQQLDTRVPGESSSVGWAANAHGVDDTHVPESFTQVTFSSDRLR